MADYDLYYWPAPFREQFIRAILAFAGKSWEEHDSGEIGALMSEAPRDQPAPFMGPPVLVERRTGFAVAQMPAITLYLGETLDLIPDNAQARALSAKLVNDANDVIDEITLDGGREMWTDEKWRAFVPRLQRWMAIFEAMGARSGLEAESGYLLGTREAGAADIVVSTLWSTMADRFPSIAALLAEHAPAIAGLTRRLQEELSLAALRRESFERYGDAYCGGEIETSLRRVVG